MNTVRRIWVAQLFALVALLCCLIPLEWANWRELQAAGADWTVGVVSLNVETWLILALPYFWLVRRPLWSPPGRWWMSLKAWWLASPRYPAGSTSASSNPMAWCMARRGEWLAIALIGATSLAVCDRVWSHRVGEQGQYRFGELPPAYHDEYSYLFQAETYLAGRWSFPSHPTAARLFDQMHVVNEGRFASRYFPATGLFIAPWLWLGCPVLGHWLAGAATCVLVFGIGRELSNNGMGLVAGMLTALSPGMALFGNLILAHHPTLLGLFLFAWAFLRWQRRGLIRELVIAGIGLSWAMLCRPMTAAGFALPFGIWFGWHILNSMRSSVSITRSVSEGDCSTKPDAELPSDVKRSPSLTLRVTKDVLALAVPLAAGFAVLMAHNHAITGEWLKSPYQLFTDIYTPRHVYGFNNVTRGEQHLGPRVLENYDRWAENLTPALAAENTKRRLLASWQWTVGLIPLLGATVAFVLSGSDRDRRRWLILASIASLFAAHVPYWFVGMFEWHYVFESGPLWCLVLAAVSDSLCRHWLSVEIGRPRMPIWITLLMAASILSNHVDTADSPSKLIGGTNQIAFSRLRYQAFDELVESAVGRDDALVLIEADPADRHIDYVVNSPSLSAQILRGRYPLADWPLNRIASTFPDRKLYLFHARTGTLSRVSR